MSKIKGIAVFCALVNILSFVNSNAVQCLDNLTKIENVKPKNETSKNDVKKKENLKDKFKLLGQKETYKKAWNNMKENKVPYISSAGLAFLLGAIISRKTPKEGLDFLSAEDFTFYTKPYQTDSVEHDDYLVGSIKPEKSQSEAIQKLKNILNKYFADDWKKVWAKMETSGIFKYFDFDSQFDFHLFLISFQILRFKGDLLTFFANDGCKLLVLKNNKKSFIAKVEYWVPLPISGKYDSKTFVVYYNRMSEKIIIFPCHYYTEKYKKTLADYHSCFNPKYYNEIDLKNKDTDGIPKISHFLCDGDKKVKVLSDEEIKQKKEK